MKIYSIILILVFSSCQSQFLGPEKIDGAGAGHTQNMLLVGPGRDYATPGAAARVAVDGDVIEIAAGVYSGDVAVWRQNNLTIRGLGGRPHIKADGANAEGKGTWVVKGNNTTIENIEFSGATVPDQNGAAIRQEGAGLVIRHCFFHDNENGILTGGDPASNVVIEYSEFFHNGFGDGYTHNMYIGEVNSFTLRFCYSHGAKIGHNVKSRARLNYILYNRIMDEQDGTSSYDIDLPNGGTAFIIGNSLQQGRHTDNPTMLSFGAEGLHYSPNELYVVNNTFVNDLGSGRFIYAQANANVVKVINNIFYGSGDVVNQPAELQTNLIATDPKFVNPGEYDYHLNSNSLAVDAGSDPGAVGEFDLTPAAHYIHPTKAQKRITIRKIDIGAYEYMIVRNSVARMK